MIGVFAGSIVAILFNNILMRMAGSDGVRQSRLCFMCQELFNAVYRGYATGIAPVISYNFGRDDSVRLKKIHSISTKIILLASFVLTGVCIVLAPTLVEFFAGDNQSVLKGSAGFRIFR